MRSTQSLFQVSSGSPRVAAMEGLRAYAAGIVYLLHLVSSFAFHRSGVGFGELSVYEVADIDALYVPLYWIYRSQYGVDIFFLLSGYLIAGLVLRQGFSYPLFLYHRFLRIYPTLIVSTLAYVAYSLFIAGGDLWLGGVLGNLLLLNGIPGYGFPPINIVTWSLFFEFAFYFTFPLIWWLCRGRLAWFVAVAGIVTGVLCFQHGTYSRFLMFVGGVVLKVAADSNRGKSLANLNEWVVIALYLLATTSFVFVKSWVLFIVIYLVPAMLLVHKALAGDGYLSKLFAWQPMRSFGNISFSFYLFHLLALTLSRDVLAPFSIASDVVYFLAYFALSFLLSFVFSLLCFSFVEKNYFAYKSVFDSWWYSWFGNPKG